MRASESEARRHSFDEEGPEAPSLSRPAPRTPFARPRPRVKGETGNRPLPARRGKRLRHHISGLLTAELRDRLTQLACNEEVAVIAVDTGACLRREDRTEPPRPAGGSLPATKHENRTAGMVDTGA